MKNLKFSADFALVPMDVTTTKRSIEDLDMAEGYMTLEGVEDPGDSVPAGMSAQDWAIYRSNWLAAVKALPEGGKEGEASFLKEHPDLKYPGDVVHDTWSGLIHIWKGAAGPMAKAEEIIGSLSEYPVLDDNEHSALETEALEEELDGWAMDDAKKMLGYGGFWSEELTDEESAWMAQLAESDPAKHAEIEAAIESIFELSGDNEQKFRMAVRDGLTYGDWTVVHKEPMIKLLQQEAPELVDPKATMHQFLKTAMADATPGSAADMKSKEDAGQLRLLESLRAAQQIVAGQREIKAMVAATEAVTKAKSVANMVAKIVGGHLATEAAGGGFFTYAVKGRLMAALFKAHADNSFSLSWAPMSGFTLAVDAAKALSTTAMLSFDTTTRLKVLSSALIAVKPMAPHGVAGAKDDIGAATLGGVVRAKKSNGLKAWMAVQSYAEHAGADPLCVASRRRLSMWAKTPKGFEPVVKELKKKGGVDNPWAVAWSMKNRGIKPKAFKVESGLQSDSSEGIAKAIPGSESLATGGGFEAVILPTNLLPESLREIGSMIAYMDNVAEGQVVVNFGPYSDPGQDSSVYGHSLFVKVPKNEVKSANWKNIADLIVAEIKAKVSEIESWIPDMKSKGADVSPKPGADVENEEIFTPSSKIVAGDMDFEEKKEWLKDADPQWFKGEGAPTDQQVQEAFDKFFGPFDKGDEVVAAKGESSLDPHDPWQGRDVKPTAGDRGTPEYDALMLQRAPEKYGKYLGDTPRRKAAEAVLERWKKEGRS